MTEFKGPLEIVRHFSLLIDNGRSINDIFEHTISEMEELNDEIEHVYNGRPEGSDGIVGESIDVIACALDLIFKHKPAITDDEINAILLRKCEKWARRYKDSVDGDRTID